MVKVEHRNFHNGFVTIAYDIDATQPQIHYAVAFCSPLDSFSRRKGKLITEGRLGVYRSSTKRTRATDLVDRNLCGSIPLSTNHLVEPKKREVIDRIFNEVSSKKYGPDQIRWAPLPRVAG